jgi:hypothetical protein
MDRITRSVNFEAKPLGEDNPELQVSSIDVVFTEYHCTECHITFILSAYMILYIILFSIHSQEGGAEPVVPEEQEPVEEQVEQQLQAGLSGLQFGSERNPTAQYYKEKSDGKETKAAADAARSARAREKKKQKHLETAFHDSGFVATGGLSGAGTDCVVCLTFYMLSVLFPFTLL